MQPCHQTLRSLSRRHERDVSWREQKDEPVEVWRASSSLMASQRGEREKMFVGWKFQSSPLVVLEWRKCICLEWIFSSSSRATHLFPPPPPNPPPPPPRLHIPQSHLSLMALHPLFPSPISEQRGGASATCDIPTREEKKERKKERPLRKDFLIWAAVVLRIL